MKTGRFRLATHWWLVRGGQPRQGAHGNSREKPHSWGLDGSGASITGRSTLTISAWKRRA